MQTRKVESVITMAKLYDCLPSEVLGIKDDYTAFCFNEACAVITMKLKDGEVPHYGVMTKQDKYSSFSDFYDNII